MADNNIFVGATRSRTYTFDLDLRSEDEDQTIIDEYPTDGENDGTTSNPLEVNIETDEQ